MANVNQQIEFFSEEEIKAAIIKGAELLKKWKQQGIEIEDGIRNEAQDNEIRVCSKCNSLMIGGYCIGGGEDYYCNDHCLHQDISPEEWENMYDEDGDSYWTVWYYDKITLCALLLIIKDTKELVVNSSNLEMLED